MPREQANQNHNDRDEQKDVDQATGDPEEQPTTPEQDKNCGNDE